MIYNIYVDGACRNNQSNNNKGAYGVYIENFDEYSGEVCKNTTNNIMELSAVLSALIIICERYHYINGSYNNQYIIYSDSQYVVSGINEWLPNWKDKDYKNVKNAELWKAIDTLLTVVKGENCSSGSPLQLTAQTAVKPEDRIKFIKVKGHDDCSGNIKIDKYINKLMDQST